MPRTSTPTSSGCRPRLKTNEVDVAGLGQRLRVGGDREDAEQQDGGADDLGDQVRPVLRMAGPVAEHAELRRRDPPSRAQCGR